MRDDGVIVLDSEPVGSLMRLTASWYTCRLCGDFLRFVFIKVDGSGARSLPWCKMLSRLQNEYHLNGRFISVRMAREVLE